MRTSRACGTSSTTRCSRTRMGQTVEGFLFIRAARSTATLSPENIPTPEDYRGYVSCTGPRACYDESKRYGETLCVNFARQHDVHVTHGPPVQQLRARAEDHRQAGPSRTLPRTSSPGRTSSCSPTARRSGRSATPPTRSWAITRSSCSGRRGEPYNVGVEKPGDLGVRAGEKLVATRARSLRLHGEARPPDERRGGLSHRQPATAAAPSLPRRRKISATTATILVTRVCGAPCSGTTTIARRRTLMSVSVIGTGYVGIVRVSVWRRRATTSSASTSMRRRCARSGTGTRRSSRLGSRDAPEENHRADASTRRPTCARRCWEAS